MHRSNYISLQKSQPQSSNKMYNVHPLVHLATREWIEVNGSWRYWNEQTVARLLQLISDENAFGKEIWSPYVPHTVHVVELPDNRHVKGRIWLLKVLSKCEWRLGYIRPSIHRSRLAAEQGEELLDKEYSDLTSVSTRVKVMIFQSASYKAIELLRETIAAEIKAQGGAVTHKLLICVTHLAAAWSDFGRFKSAEMLLREQLAREERCLESYRRR
jgi:endonuclease/exonuclease/phosphatase family metal-dependent hydrolase